MGHTHYIGTVTELEVTKAFIECGFNVAKPVVPESRYDLILDAYGHLFKVQVKSPDVAKDGKSLVIHTYSMSATPDGYKRVLYTNDDVDLFATAYAGHVYVVPFNEIQNKSGCTLRLEPTKNNQSVGIRYAEQYDLNNIVNRQKMIGYSE